MNNRSKRLVVHFDRLKQCHPNTRFSDENTKAEGTGPPEKPQEAVHDDEPVRHEFGRQLEVVDDDFDADVSPHRNPTTRPHDTGQDSSQHSTGRRYPSRSRRPPERYRTEYGTYS